MDDRVASLPAEELAAQERRRERRMPAEEGIWVLILGDMMIFSLFFASFLYYRSKQLPLYLDSQAKLDPDFGVAYTLLLLLSSWFVVLAVKTIRAHRPRPAPALFAGAWLCGAGFVALKVVEYGAKVSAGITPLTNEFFMFYFAYTGIHLLHVLIGLGVLVFLLLKSRRTGGTPREMRTFESGGAFWHLVDLLWIVLFPLLYLVR
jgi:nitric oxide reductase NorE protein